MQHQHLPQLHDAVIRDDSKCDARQGDVNVAPGANDQARTLLALQRTPKTGAFAEYLVGPLKVADLLGGQYGKEVWQRGFMTQRLFAELLEWGRFTRAQPPNRQ